MSNPQPSPEPKPASVPGRLQPSEPAAVPKRPVAAAGDPTPPQRPPPAQPRRGFFGEVFHALALPAVDVLDQRFNLGLADLRDHVRPPGAVPESVFLERCRKTGYCVDACPVKAIAPLPEYHGRKAEVGTPVIVAETQPCVMCADLACMAACPTGALLPVSREEIRIATASWNPHTCLRTRADGEREDCRACVESCPMRERVIRLDADGRVRINPSTCTGCGVCVFYCPTEPNSITLEPR